MDWTTISHFKRVFELSLSGAALESLPRFEVLPQSLTVLILEKATLPKFWDFNQLKSLKKMNMLSFKDIDKIERISDLSALTSLQVLDFSFTSITHLPKLPSSLQYLLLSNTNFTDLKQLKQQQQLQNLTLDHTLVKDLAAIRSLSNLKYLSLKSTPVIDITPLTYLRKLEVLDLRETLITDFSPLQQLPVLHTIKYPTLEICDIKISVMARELKCSRPLKTDEYKHLKRLSNLRNLSLEQVDSELIKILNTLKKLRRLTLKSFDFISISQISNLDKLHEITLLKARTIDLTGIHYLIALQALTIIDVDEPLQLEPLKKGSIPLKKMSLHKVQIKHEDAIGSIHSLHSLTLKQVKLSTLSFMRHLDQLDSLEFQRSPEIKNQRSVDNKKEANDKTQQTSQLKTQSMHFIDLKDKIIVKLKPTDGQTYFFILRLALELDDKKNTVKVESKLPQIYALLKMLFKSYSVRELRDPKSMEKIRTLIRVKINRLFSSGNKYIINVWPHEWVVVPQEFDGTKSNKIKNKKVLDK